MESIIEILDPRLTDVLGGFLVVCGKYAIFFGLAYFGVRMIVRVFTGKERFL